jgi:hypothetical protein
MNDKTSMLFFVSGVVLFAVAEANRLLDAQANGDVWLAFQTDSFMGWPLTHIAGILSCVFFALGCLLLKKSLVHAQESKAEGLV